MRAQLGQALGIQPEIMTRAAPLFFHQPGGFQNLKMLRNGRAAYRQAFRYFADRGWPPAQQIENRLPGGIGESAQQRLLVGHTLP